MRSFELDRNIYVDATDPRYTRVLELSSQLVEAMREIRLETATINGLAMVESGTHSLFPRTLASVEVMKAFRNMLRHPTLGADPEVLAHGLMVQVESTDEFEVFALTKKGELVLAADNAIEAINLAPATRGTHPLAIILDTPPAKIDLDKLPTSEGDEEDLRVEGRNGPPGS